MSRLFLCVLVGAALWSVSVLSASVFSERAAAHTLLRTRRANAFLEELKPPNMERECVEEVCDFEEAREIFQSREATLEFWTVYTDGNQCISHMCVNGSCVDQFQDYVCLCDHGYEGKYCDQRQVVSNCSLENGDCDHECVESKDGQARTCSCMDGYTLQDNGRTCVATGSASCGQLGISRSSYTKRMDGLLPWMVGGEVGKKGESPWQVMLLNARGGFQCGAVLIDQNWVLTAAHCLNNHLQFWVRLGDYERLRKERSEVTMKVVRTFKHPDYNSRTEDNDIALLRLEHPAPFSQYIIPICLPGRQLAEQVLHRNGTMTVVTGWGADSANSSTYSSALNFIKVPVVSRSVCAQHMSNHITDSVLCAGTLGRREDACRGDSGGPMVTLYRETWFLVGLVSWGEGCGELDKLGIYTKVSKYNEWMERVRKEWDERHSAQV